MLKHHRLVLWGLVVFVLSLASLPGINKLYYWRDDWVFLWSNKNNPPVLYNEIGAPQWWIKSGLLHPLYARLYSQISVESLQVSGIFIKALNSLAFFLLIYSLTRKKTPSVLAMLLFASYGGGAETYTWHRITGIATGFAMLAFSFHNLYLSSLKKIYILGVVLTAVLALFSYFGRVIGIFPVFIFSILLVSWKSFTKNYVLYGLMLCALFIGLFGITKSAISATSGFSITTSLQNNIKNINVYFSNVGNLVLNPFVKLPESGGLMGRVLPFSLRLGIGLFVTWIFFTLIFIFTKKEFYKNLSLCFAWLFITYFPNWMYAGGGPGTMIGSVHRYFGISALFLPLIIGIIFSKLPKIIQVIVFVILLIITMNYSKYLMDQELYLHNSDKIAGIYKEIVNATSDDPLPRLIVIDTQLDYLATGWFSYAYGYFKGIQLREDFPPVFSNYDAAIQWLCANPQDRNMLGTIYGVPNYQSNRPILVNNIYAWRFTKDGKLTNMTTLLRNAFNSCNQAK